MTDKIEIQEVVPDFFASVQERSSDVWGKNVCLERGVSYAISAASGKGKSTLLNILFGIRKIPNGKVLYNAQDLANFAPNERSVLRSVAISMVFQDLRLFEHLTARENIEIKRRIRADRSWSEITSWCDQLDVTALLDTPCLKLSLGQQQRIAIIRALVSPFEWLFMDEPTSHLDQINAGKVLNLVHAECKKRSAGLIITTLENHPKLGQDRILYC